MSLASAIAVLLSCGGTPRSVVDPVPVATEPEALKASDAPRFGAIECPSGSALQHHEAIKHDAETRPESLLSRLGCAGSLGPRSDGVEGQVLSACQSSGAGQSFEAAGSPESWSCHLPDGTRHGPFHERLGSGSEATSVGQYANGDLAGENRSWDQDGQPQSLRTDSVYWQRRPVGEPSTTPVFSGAVRLYVLGTAAWRVVLLESQNMDTVIWLGAEQETAPLDQRDLIRHFLLGVLASEHMGLYVTKRPGLFLTTGRVAPTCDGQAGRSYGLIGGMTAPKLWSFAQTKRNKCLRVGHRAWKARREENRLHNGQKTRLGTWEAELLREHTRFDPSYDVRFRDDSTTACVQLSVGRDAALPASDECVSIAVAGDQLSLGIHGSEPSTIALSDRPTLIDVWKVGR